MGPKKKRERNNDIHLSEPKVQRRCHARHLSLAKFAPAQKTFEAKNISRDFKTISSRTLERKRKDGEF